MDVHLNPDLEAKLSRIAAEQGRPAEALVQEAVEKLVDYDEWFLREVMSAMASGNVTLDCIHVGVQAPVNVCLGRSSTDHPIQEKW